MHAYTHKYVACIYTLIAFRRLAKQDWDARGSKVPVLDGLKKSDTPQSLQQALNEQPDFDLSYFVVE